MKPKKNRPLPPPLTHEQELLQDFQQGEAAELRDEPVAVDKKFRDVRGTWGDLAETGPQE